MFYLVQIITYNTHAHTYFFIYLPITRVLIYIYRYLIATDQPVVTNNVHAYQYFSKK